MKKKLTLLLCLVSVISLLFTGCTELLDGLLEGGGDGGEPPVSLEDIPAFDGTADYVVINGNVPFFTEDEITAKSYEYFSELDSLGRCGVAHASIGKDLMPTEQREDIGHVTPSGWQSVSYDIVPGGHLYNRCHLIGFQLTGENDNERNLITGTRNMNNEGMLPFENMIADYIKETGNHVMYRVTPIYEGDELVARGVLMEALSVEDDEIRFCIYVYNNQAGITINYANGESRLADDPLSELVGSGHDESEILPAEADDSVTAIYAETVDGEYSGCLVTVTVMGYAANVTLAIDIDEHGDVVMITVISESETHGKSLDAFLRSFEGLDSESADDAELVSGATVSTTAIRNAVLDALEAVECYTDAIENGRTYVINTSSGKFHKDTCKHASSMSESNKLVYVGYYADLAEAGYTACGVCKPE